MQALAAANPKHSPPYVKEKKHSQIVSYIFFLPTTAERGTPLDIALAKQDKSGFYIIKFLYTSNRVPKSCHNLIKN